KRTLYALEYEIVIGTSFGPGKGSICSTPVQPSAATTSEESDRRASKPPRFRGKCADIGYLSIYGGAVGAGEPAQPSGTRRWKRSARRGGPGATPPLPRPLVWSAPPRPSGVIQIEPEPPPHARSRPATDTRSVTEPSPSTPSTVPSVTALVRPDL